MKNINFMEKEKELSIVKEIPMFSSMKTEFTALTSNSEKYSSH